jgi:hypothetical protein
VNVARSAMATSCFLLMVTRLWVSVSWDAWPARCGSVSARCPRSIWQAATHLNLDAVSRCHDIARCFTNGGTETYAPRAPCEVMRS